LKLDAIDVPCARQILREVIGVSVDGVSPTAARQGGDASTVSFESNPRESWFSVPPCHFCVVVQKRNIKQGRTPGLTMRDCGTGRVRYHRHAASWTLRHAKLIVLNSHEYTVVERVGDDHPPHRGHEARLIVKRALAVQTFSKLA